MTEAVATSEDLSHDVIDRGGVTTQQMLVVGLCMFFNMLDGFFDICLGGIFLVSRFFVFSETEAAVYRAAHVQ